MYKQTVYLPVLLLTAVTIMSCRGHFYKAPSGGMDGTIATGQQFYVTETSSFKRNDIAVFDFYGNDYQSLPDDEGHFKQHWEKRVYRILAVSGDTLQVKEGEVFVNGKSVPLAKTGKMEYEVVATMPIEEFQNDPAYSFVEKKADLLYYYVNLTTPEAHNYEEKKPAIVAVRKKLKEYIPGDTSLAVTCDSCHWTTDEFGPIIIPSPGETINVTSSNRRLYHNIPGIQDGKNIVKEKLYFVMGDNRHAAEDSRYIGLITQSKMYGVVK